MAELHGMGTSAACKWTTELMTSFIPVHHAKILFLLFAASLSGCTNLKPIAMEPETLQENIRDGKVVREGDTIRVVTNDGVSHLLVVTGADQHTIQGYAAGAPPGAIVIDIPIDDILMLDEEKVHAGETAASSVGVVTIAVAVAIIIAPVAVLSALGVI